MGRCFMAANWRSLASFCCIESALQFSLFSISVFMTVSQFSFLTLRADEDDEDELFSEVVLAALLLSHCCKVVTFAAAAVASAEMQLFVDDVAIFNLFASLLLFVAVVDDAVATAVALPPLPFVVAWAICR